jgi:hypothetical protein
MIVDEAIFEPLQLLYEEYKSSAIDKEKFFNAKRKETKILVDSLTEQIVEELIKEKPRHALNARQLINQARGKVLGNEDIVLLDELASVLKQYDVLDDKSYIDHARKMEDLFNGALRKLCIALSRHPWHRRSGKARMLAHTLKGL